MLLNKGNFLIFFKVDLKILKKKINLIFLLE
jgi:hypothetical protein